MTTRKASYLSVVLVFLIAALAVTAAAQEVIYISEPSVYDDPKILPRLPAPVDRDFVRNPALLELGCRWEFFSDLNYHGGTYKTSTSNVWGPDVTAWINHGSSDSSYYLHALGGDAGFAMKMGDSSNLAALVSYRWGYLYGETDFQHVAESIPASLDGSWEERLNSHAFGLSLLYNHAFSDSFTLGTGLKYSYVTERLRRQGSGNGSLTIVGVITFPEALLIDRDISLGYHRFAPVLGVLVTPSDRFKIDASVEAGFSFGRVGVESNLVDENIFSFLIPSVWYSDDAESRDLFGWDIAAKVRPVITLSDRLSIPLVLDFTYRRFDWDADGAAYGYFAPLAYGGIFQGPGTVDYENSTRSWDFSAGAGVTYDAGWATLAGMLSYTHWDFTNDYDQENWVAGMGVLDGLTYFSQDDNEIRDSVSLGVMVEKKFSPMVSAALGLRYDIGWGRRDYSTDYASPYESLGAGTLTFLIDGDGRDMYQDLTLTTGLTVTPAERLTIALGGMVKIPLDPLDYEMEGTVVVSPAAPAPFRFPGSGPFVRDYEASGWEYGGLLTITYEFGCPAPAPPVREEPKVEPKLEPMSMR